MSYAIHVQVRAALTDPLPGWVAAYLEGISGPERREVRARPPAADDPDGSWAELPTGDWFVGVPCGLAPGPYTGTRTFWMSGEFHDDFVGCETMLFLLLARVAAGNQVLGASWISEDSARATSWTAHGGELFAAASGPWEHQSTTGRTLPPPAEFLARGRPRDQRTGLEQHGAGPAALAHHDTVAAPHQPTLARHLLARSLARTLAEHGAADALGPVLRVLDDGADPLAGPRAPGWTVGETWPAYRGRRPTSRVLAGDLEQAGAALGGSVLDAAPAPGEGRRG